MKKILFCIMLPALFSLSGCQDKHEKYIGKYEYLKPMSSPIYKQIMEIKKDGDGYIVIEREGGQQHTLKKIEAGFEIPGSVIFSLSEDNQTLYFADMTGKRISEEDYQKVIQEIETLKSDCKKIKKELAAKDKRIRSENKLDEFDAYVDEFQAYTEKC